jgi:bifunctional DNA-binding transcriptional regulator/antitoxin component of YhaV-PrlF toxin-antitoxin module
MQVMGEITTIAKASTNFASLRTVIPMFIVKQWQLKEGDKLDWQIEARNNEVVLVVRKAGENITQTGIPAEDVRREIEKQKHISKKKRFNRVTTS